MTKSQAIAIRCAKSLPSNLLFRGWRQHPGREIASILGMTEAAIHHAVNAKLAIQLTKCADEEAQRLILGVKGKK